MAQEMQGNPRPGGGLLSGAPQGNPPAPPVDSASESGQAASGQPMGIEERQATPEQQDQYNRIVGRALEIVYNEKTLPRIVQMLRGGSREGEQGNPAEGLAQTAAMIVGRVANAAEQAGQKIDGVALFKAGTAVFEDLADLSKRAGIKDYAADRNTYDGAYFRAIDIFRGMMQDAGELDRTAFQKDFDMLKSMDNAGQLEPLFRKLAQNDAGGRPAPSQQEPAGGLMPEEAA